MAGLRCGIQPTRESIMSNGLRDRVRAATASPTNLAWLERTVEEPLEPDLPICDPHHHLWEFRHERVAHRYLLDDILREQSYDAPVAQSIM